jgi:four helix bundle protein
MRVIQSHLDLDVYREAFAVAQRIFEESKAFPKEEKYSMVDPIRRFSCSVCANIAEAWRKQGYEALFVKKLIDAEGEAAETQVWLQFALHCGYLKGERADELIASYEIIIAKLVRLRNNPGVWLLPGAKRRRQRSSKFFPLFPFFCPSSPPPLLSSSISISGTPPGFRRQSAAWRR